MLVPETCACSSTIKFFWPCLQSIGNLDYHPQPHTPISTINIIAVPSSQSASAKIIPEELQLYQHLLPMSSNYLLPYQELQLSSSHNHFTSYSTSSRPHTTKHQQTFITIVFIIFWLFVLCLLWVYLLPHYFTSSILQSISFKLSFSAFKFKTFLSAILQNLALKTKIFRICRFQDFFFQALKSQFSFCRPTIY